MQALIAKISLPAIRANAKTIKQVASRKLIAVVKDDGYGHGAEEVAFSLRDVADGFAVATVEEGAALRCAGVTEDILVLTPPLTLEEGVRLLSYGLTASLTSLPALNLLASAAEKIGACPRAHLAVNTGMNRYGFLPARAGRAARLARERGISVEGVFSHYFEPEEDGAREEQAALFSAALSAVKEVFPDCLSHLSATGGTLRTNDGFQAVRVGLGLYGYQPQSGKLPLRRAMKLYATVSHRTSQFGAGAGYALADRYYGNLHTLRLGYGDGFWREGTEKAVGRLCMDAAIMEGDAPFGARRLVLSDFSVYARAHNTSVYEALVRLSSKAVKEYLREPLR